MERGPLNDREDLIDREPAIRISPFSVHQLGCNFIPMSLRDSLYKCTCISKILFYCFYTPAPKETGELLVIQVQSRVYRDLPRVSQDSDFISYVPVNQINMFPMSNQGYRYITLSRYAIYAFNAL